MRRIKPPRLWAAFERFLDERPVEATLIFSTLMTLGSLLMLWRSREK